MNNLGKIRPISCFCKVQQERFVSCSLLLLFAEMGGGKNMTSFCLSQGFCYWFVCNCINLIKKEFLYLLLLPIKSLSIVALNYQAKNKNQAITIGNEQNSSQINFPQQNTINYNTKPINHPLQQLQKKPMGIDGLLTLLKPLIKKEHISSFRNKTIGIDALPWIYKGIYGANIQMGQNIYENPNAFLYYIIEMIDMLQFYNIKPIFIFDGKSLEAKYKTLEKRKKSKEEQKKKAEQLIEKNQVEKGNKTMARYINIDENKLCLVMSLLKEKNIDFVVAPYQADSQICKLFKLGDIQAVITQDSDLIIYGVDVILKLKETGQCDYLTLNQEKQDISSNQCVFLQKFCNFTPQKRIQAAILSGCDYVDSVKGIGLKKAIKLIEENDSFQKVVLALKKDSKLGSKVPQNYQALIQNAKLIFLFAKTFNPKSNQLEYLNEDFLNEIEGTDKISKQELDQIVGKSYSFSSDCYYGKVNCKTQEERKFEKISMKQIYSLNRQNINFEMTEKSQMRQKIKSEAKEILIDQTTSICWEGDSVNEGLMFLLQKQLVTQFFNKIEQENVPNNGGQVHQTSQ